LYLNRKRLLILNDIELIILLMGVILVKILNYYFFLNYIDWIIYLFFPIIFFFSWIVLKKCSSFYVSNSLKLLFILFIYSCLDTVYNTFDIVKTLKSCIIFFSYFLTALIFYNARLKIQLKQKIIYLLLVFMLFLSLHNHSISSIRIDGLLGNPNLTAFFAVLFFPIIMYFFNSKIILQFIVSLILFFLIVKTGSRSSLLVFLFMIMIHIIYQFKILKFSFRNNILIIIVILILTIFSMDIAKFLINDTILSNIVSGTRFSYTGDNHRFLIWIEAFNLFKDNILFGVGIGFKFHDISSIHNNLGFHSTYMYVLVSLGIIGFLLFLLFLLFLVKENSFYSIINHYKFLQLIAFITLSYSATIYFVGSFYFYLLAFQFIKEKKIC